MALPLPKTAQSKTKKPKRLRADQILSLCATGRLGIREAIAKTAKQHRKIRAQKRARLTSRVLGSEDKGDKALL
jgi:hypothetical protein